MTHGIVLFGRRAVTQEGTDGLVVVLSGLPNVDDWEQMLNILLFRLWYLVTDIFLPWCAETGHLLSPLQNTVLAHTATVGGAYSNMGATVGHYFSIGDLEIQDTFEVWGYCSVPVDHGKIIPFMDDAMVCNDFWVLIWWHDWFVLGEFLLHPCKCTVHGQIRMTSDWVSVRNFERISFSQILQDERQRVIPILCTTPIAEKTHVVCMNR